MKVIGSCFNKSVKPIQQIPIDYPIWLPY